MLLTCLLKDTAAEVTNRVTEEYELRRRQARRITVKTMDLLVQDFEEIDM